MKTKQLTKVLLPVILAFVLAISGFAMLFASKGYASASVSDVIAGFSSEYATGTEIEVPDAYFTDGGGEIKATKIVYYPDGTMYSVGKFTPTVMGNYTIEYSATTASGDYLSQSKDIYVYQDLYQVTGKGSEVSYGANQFYAPNTPGIQVKLGTSGEFKFNKIINIADVTGYNPFISMFITPEKVQDAEAESFTIRLVDIYDSKNYVEIVGNNTREGLTYKHNITYLSAGAAFQPTTGIEWGFNKVHSNNIYGFPTEFSFFGCNKSGATNEAYFNTTPGGKLDLYFDLDTKQLRTSPTGVGNPIIDLDDSAYFSDPWTGFTTGEVFLSITAKVTKSNFNFVITNIAGEDLTSGKIVDDSAPAVTVKTGNYDANNLPHAVVGQAYPVFESTAYDPFSGNLETNVAVYQNYGSPAQSFVDVIDGKFTPIVPGNYYVVYSATDYSGNKGETIHKIVCDKEGAPVNLSVATEGRVTASSVGEKIVLPKTTATGGNGYITVTPTVTGPNGSSVEVVDGKFQPLTAGTYTVTFTAKDFVSTTATQSYELVVTLSNKPVFEDDAVLPKYIITGYEYVLPALKAYDFSNAKAEMDVTIKVTDDNGERTLDSDRKATFTVNEVGTTKNMTVKYISSNSNGTTEKVYTVKVIDARKLVNGNNRLDVSKYFYTEDLTINATDDYMGLVAKKDGTVEFINPLITPSLSINFVTQGIGSTLGNLTIRIEDIEDDSKSIVMEMSKNKAGLTNVYLNGAGPYEVNVPYNNGEFNIGYDDFENKITIDGTNYFSINQYADGSEFKGFPSKKARLYFDFENVTGTANVQVKRINGQELYAKTMMDRVAPRVAVPEAGTRTRGINEIVTVAPAVAGDVLDPDIPLTVRVIDEQKKVVTSIDGIVLDDVPADRDYQIKLSQYGQYRITYSTVDDADNDAGQPILFTVVDPEAPVIKLSRNNVTSATKGSTIVLAPFTVTDNYTPDNKITTCCFVVRPSGSIFTVNMKDSNSFVANEVGTYILRYIATDEHGNITVLNYTLTITG